MLSFLEFFFAQGMHASCCPHVYIVGGGLYFCPGILSDPFPLSHLVFPMSCFISFRDPWFDFRLRQVDRDSARLSGEVENEIFDLFVQLGADDDQMEYSTLYASGKQG